MPYLGRGKQDEALADYSEGAYPNAKADQRIQIFLLINTELKNQPEQEQLKRRLLSTIQSSEFYQIYPFQEIELNTPQFPTLQKLDWVNALVEISKAETISPKGYYLPRLFPENQDHDMVKICEQLSRIRSERFLLEITLQPHNNPSERQKALDSIEALLKAQSTPQFRSRRASVKSPRPISSSCLPLSARPTRRTSKLPHLSSEARRSSGAIRRR